MRWLLATKAYSSVRHAKRTPVLERVGFSLDRRFTGLRRVPCSNSEFVRARRRALLFTG